MNEPALNPYASPTAHVADIPSAAGVAELKFFSSKGRIGRLRYLAYGTGAGILYNIAATLLTLMLSSSALSFLMIVSFAVLLWFSVVTGIKRCHDMGISGWWSLTLVIPLIVFAWIFWPGSKDANSYGPPPPPNNWGVRILAFIFPFFFVLGILAAVSIPAYKMYTDKARAAQQSAPAK